jgi:DNA-binding winged helix-turn-helix (wHTH) protein/Tol biopolymer transport system component
VVFGLFEADIASGELYCSGRRVPLQEKPFRILARMLDQPGEVVTREELRKQLWPDGISVDFDEGLDTAVKKLRYALGDSAQNPTFLETIPRRGYRFIAPVSLRDLSPTVPIVIDATPSAPSSAALPVRFTKLGFFLVLLLFALLLAVAYGVFRWRSRARQPALSRLQMTALTHNGQVQGVAISPDGQYVVYASGAADRQSLWLHEVAGQRDQQLVPTGAGFHGLTFSPDNGSIYFVRSDKNDPYFKYLYVTPTQGGTVRKLITDVDSPVSFSPDGTRFVYEHCLQPRDDVELRIANADGSNDRVLTVIHHGSGMFFQPGPNWSPDGRTIAVPVMESGNQRWVLDVISVVDGSSKELYSGARELGRPVWLAGGTALLFPFRESVNNRFQLWTVSFPEGSAQPVTHDVSNYGADLDMARNRRFLVTTAAVTSSHIWMAPASDLSQSRQVTSDSGPIPRQIAEAFDGKLLVQGDDQTVWMMHTDGSQRFRFTDLQPADEPTRCGRFVILRVFQKDSLALTRFDKDGSHPTVLVRGDVYSPACSADSEFLFYVTGDQPQKIWKVPVMGGNQQYVVDVLGDQFTMPLVASPDGRFLAYGYTNYGRVPSKGWSIAVIPVGGGVPVKQFVVQAMDDSVLRWSPSGKALQYLVTQNGVTNLWDQPLAGGKPKQLTQFSSGQIFDFNWSSDHMWLLMIRGSTNADAVLLSNLSDL